MHHSQTSLQYGRLADRVLEEYSASEGDVSLSKMREEIGSDPADLAKVLKSFYGFGDTAVEIFRRRMQKDWAELYPCVFPCYTSTQKEYLPTRVSTRSFADERTLNAAAHFGLSHDSSGALAEQVDELLGSAEDEDEKRRRFTTIVDALVACDLEHKYDEVEEVLSASTPTKKEEDGEPDSKAAKKE